MTPQGKLCSRTVDFISIYPTLCDLAGLDKPAHLEGPSLLSLLKNPDTTWDRPAVTTHGFNQHAARSERWRYIRYADGSEELYDHDADPYEWKNLANRPEHEGVKKQLADAFPKINKPEVARGKVKN